VHLVTRQAVYRSFALSLCAGPDFAINGKGNIMVLNLLLHNAGFPPDPEPVHTAHTASHGTAVTEGLTARTTGISPSAALKPSTAFPGKHALTRTNGSVVMRHTRCTQRVVLVPPADLHGEPQAVAHGAQCAQPAMLSRGL
jgi:hypothetical protein